MTRVPIDPEVLAEQYAAGGSIRALAVLHRVSFGTMRCALIAAGVPLRSPGGRADTLIRVRSSARSLDIQ